MESFDNLKAAVFRAVVAGHTTSAAVCKALGNAPLNQVTAALRRLAVKEKVLAREQGVSESGRPTFTYKAKAQEYEEYVEPKVTRRRRPKPVEPSGVKVMVAIGSNETHVMTVDEARALMGELGKLFK